MKFLLYIINRNTVYPICYIAGLLFLLLQFSCQQPVQQIHTADAVYTTDDNEDVKAIKDILWSIEENWNKEDLDFYGSLLADDVVSIPPNRPAMNGKITRTENIENYFKENIAEWKIKSIDDVIVSGSIAIARTTSEESWTVEATGAQNIVENSQGLLIFRKDTEGNWKIIFETWNIPGTPEEN